MSFRESFEHLSMEENLKKFKHVDGAEKIDFS